MTEEPPHVREPVEQRPGIMPVVARPRRGLSGLAIGLIAVALGLALFLVLNAQRRANLAPAVSAQSQLDTQTAVSPPPLDIPPAPLPPLRPPAPATIIATAPPFSQEQPRFVLPQQVIAAQAPAPPPQYEPPAAPPPEPRRSEGAALVLDTSAGGAQRGSGAQPSDASGASATNARQTDRVRAALLANRSTTVAQGTLIRAVLETALDSTHPGFARALVTRDIYGFDGTRVLIPRGSRLIGEYGAEINPGQNRALIEWIRLIRPDGATISIGSPSADTLGRGGIKADVNSHFLERFGGAILQSVLDIGVNVAAREAGGTVIYSLPGSTVNGIGQAVQPRQVTPTLKVKAGTSVSVFVARDLDFSQVEQ